MSLAIRIIEASHVDAELIYQTMMEAFMEYKDKLVPPSGVFTETVIGIRKLLELGEGAILAVDIDNNVRSVGSARYRFIDQYIYIGRVAVIPAYRGRGIGKLILAYLEEKALLKGFTEAQVEVRLSLPANIELYKKLNYQIVDHLYYLDKTDSWYVMSKKLNVYE